MGCPYKAMADETRRSILEYLSKGDIAAGEIANRFKISKPAISNHLKILKEAELVSEKKIKQNRIYSINKLKIRNLKNFLNQLS